MQHGCYDQPMTTMLHMTTRDVASELGCTTQHVARLVRGGTLEPMLKLPGINGAYVFAPAEVERVKRERLADRPSSPTAGVDNDHI